MAKWFNGAVSKNNVGLESMGWTVVFGCLNSIYHIQPINHGYHHDLPNHRWLETKIQQIRDQLPLASDVVAEPGTSRVALPNSFWVLKSGMVFLMSFGSDPCNPGIFFETSHHSLRWPGRAVFALQTLPKTHPHGNRSKLKTQETTSFRQVLVFLTTGVGKCPFFGILNITFKYLLDIISPIVGWCSIGTFTNPCSNPFLIFTILHHTAPVLHDQNWPDLTRAQLGMGQMITQNA